MQHQQKHSQSMIHNRDRSLQFLNSDVQDLALARIYPRRSRSRLRPVYRLIAWSLSMYPCSNFVEGDVNLLSYYETRLARIITTVDDAQNGFRNEILPMALTRQSAAASGLMEALLAVSALHLGGYETALKHKTRAIQFLHRSLSSLESSDLSTSLAASMLLCVYGVFDAVNSDWMVHLRGARGLLKQQTKTGIPDDVVTPFMRTWVLYHDVLADFAQQGHDPGVEDDQTTHLPPWSHDKTIVVGSLGCSEELMQLVSCINKLCDQCAVEDELISELEKRLYGLSQNIEVRVEKPNVSSNHGVDEPRIRRTAEFYHLAALIYFNRQIRRYPTDSPIVQSLVLTALGLVSEMEVCTSPWPMFVVACEVLNDDQRLQVLEVLTKMESRRRMGNISVTKIIVESLWKQQDLGLGEDGRAKLEWRDIADMRDLSPSFI
ncbi:hypothetical protein PV04_08232 [Phialophora macrospora]|uniref:Zn(II)2Cys6 transcription factor n=1 Tax=Phialophora macrospora TaxID=1851006 RepID=A0A0D2FDE1_9EURO|nr:hypothetical protein PV04_08232 [Phialophora macrospora]